METCILAEKFQSDLDFSNTTSVMKLAYFDIQRQANRN